MTNRNLYLVGTVHYDLEGPKRLKGLLRKISPDIISLEFHKDREKLMISKKTLEEEEREIDQFLNENELKLTSKQRKTLLQGGRILNSLNGYELRTCKDYVQENPETKLEYIDISLFKNGKKQFIVGYIAGSKEQFREMLQHPELKEPFLRMLSKGKKGLQEGVQEGVEMIYKNSEIMEELAEYLRSEESFESLKQQLPENAVQVFRQIFNPRRDRMMADRINKLYNYGAHKLVSVVGLMHIPGIKSRILRLNPTIMTLADSVNV